MKLNKKYKDRLFCLLFGNEEYKENILSLYNALCHTAHTDVNDIKLYTIDNVIYIEMKMMYRFFWIVIYIYGSSKAPTIQICRLGA